MSSTVNGWSRFLGLSLRPWSGDSPASLIVRGAIRVGVTVVVYILIVNLRQLSQFAEYENVTGVRPALFLITIMLVVVALIGVIRVVIGIIDLVPRHTIEGRVTHLAHRKAGDFLPHIAQRLLFENRSSGLDKRRERLEVVLDTPTGPRQWTVRNTKARRALRPGETVRLSVTPLTGYVARVDPLSP